MNCDISYTYNSNGNYEFNTNKTDMSSCYTTNSNGKILSTTLNSYRPYSSTTDTTTSTISIKGDCCYIQDASDCSSVGLNFSKIASGTFQDNSEDIYKLCGINSQDTNQLSSQLTSQVVSLDTTNPTIFIALIIAIFVSVLLYAIFVVGPFLFWIKYAPRMIYEKGCHAGKTILERHYCRDENELPYNWELLSGCTKPPTQVLPSLDKCPPEHSMYSDNPLGKVGGEGLWDKIVYHIGGFPYYGINKDRETLYKQYNGNLFIVSFLSLSVIFCLFYGPYIKERSPRISDLSIKIICGILLLLSIVSIPLALSKYFFKIETNGKFHAAHSGFSLLAIIAYILNVTLNHSNKVTGLILSIIFTVGFFFLLWFMSSFKNNLDKNLGFMEAFIKGIYYIRKSYINSIKYSLMGGRGTSQWWFKTIGQWPIPDWIYVILGKIVAPILVTIVFICRGLVSFWDAIRGLFGHLKTIKYRQKLEDQEKEIKYLKVSNISEAAYERTRGGGIKDKMKAGVYTYFKRFETGWSGLLLFPFGLCFSLFMTFINGLFFFFSYHFIPLTYPSIIMNIIACNIHKLGFLFGVGVLALCWKLVHENQTPIPKEVVIGMTITFAILVIYNLFTKK